MGLSLIALLLSGAQPATQSATPPPKPKLICREGESRLGTRMRTGRTCKTQEQWDEEDAARDHIPLALQVTPAQGDGVQRTTPSP